ncbi:hypothetical protein T484DRAFT_1818898 [Baffinella frigidus]|nr:hypothetical protein T484DRAFT_1818898 [Cryptophyta sp. CCMP2293]
MYALVPAASMLMEEGDPSGQGFWELFSDATLQLPRHLAHAKRLVNARVTGHADAEANCPRVVDLAAVLGNLIFLAKVAREAGPDVLCSMLDAARGAAQATSVSEAMDEETLAALAAIDRSREFAHVFRARLRNTPLAILVEEARLPALDAVRDKVMGPAGALYRMGLAAKGGGANLTAKDALVLVRTSLPAGLFLTAKDALVLVRTR